MSIISMVEPFSPDSYLYRDSSYSTDETTGATYVRLIGLRKDYVGRCIREREHNMRDDSDFYMLVWDDEKNEAREVMFASTRGWTYPCMASHVDATPETLAKYDAWRMKKERQYKASNLRQYRSRASKIASDLGISRKRAFRLIYAAKSNWKVSAAISLLTGNIRSPLKLSLRQQLRDWLASDTPKYPNPFSPKQWDCLNPWRFRTVYRTGYNRNSMDSENATHPLYDMATKYKD